MSEAEICSPCPNFFSQVWLERHIPAAGDPLTTYPVRRGTLPILGALAAFAASPAAADFGADRLVEACQVAVSVHAEQLALEFPDAVRNGEEIRLRFSFVNAERLHSGQARCAFHLSQDHVGPPSLIDLEVMGRITPSHFLMSHHAVWVFFTGQREEAIADEAEPPPAMPIEDSSGRRMRAGVTMPRHG
jgi:hypothetical protein